MAIVEEIQRQAALGQRVKADVYRGWQRGGPWSAKLGDLTVNGSSQAEALDRLAEQIVAVAEKAYDRGYLVLHDDMRTQTVCQWFGDGVIQIRVRDGRVTCSSSHVDWKTPKDAAEAATRPESCGPGVIVPL